MRYLPYCIPTELLGFSVAPTLHVNPNPTPFQNPANDNYRGAKHLEDGCNCHISPPCGFCTSLTAEEANIYAVYGVQGLAAYRFAKELVDE